MKIQELKDLVAMLAQGVKSAVAIKADGKIDMTDIPAIFTFVQKVPTALAGVGEVPAELSAMDEASAAELVAFAMSELALDEGKAKQIVDHSLKVAISLYGLMGAIKG